MGSVCNINDLVLQRRKFLSTFRSALEVEQLWMLVLVSPVTVHQTVFATQEAYFQDPQPSV